MIVLRDIPRSITCAKDVAQALQKWLSRKDRIQRDKEHMLVLMLNVRNVVQAVDIVSIGTLSTTLVHPREVYRRAITRAAAQIIIAHNHPSGDTLPSEEDIEVTKRLRQAGEIIGIDLIDHIIFARQDYYSLNENGLL